MEDVPHPHSLGGHLLWNRLFKLLDLCPQIDMDSQRQEDQMIEKKERDDPGVDPISREGKVYSLGLVSIMVLKGHFQVTWVGGGTSIELKKKLISFFKISAC